MKEQQAARLTRLYPRSWRARYGEEFAALLEQQTLSLRIIGNVLLGALDAHAHRSAATGLLALEQRLAPWLWWILAGMFGWAGLLVVMYASFLRYGVVASNAGALAVIVHLVIGVVLAGATLGAVQWLLIRRYRPASLDWIIATTAGWCVGTLLAEALLFPIVAGHVQFGWPGDTLLRGGEFGLVVGAVSYAVRSRMPAGGFSPARLAGAWAGWSVDYAATRCSAAPTSDRPFISVAWWRAFSSGPPWAEPSTASSPRRCWQRCCGRRNRCALPSSVVARRR